MTGLAVLIMTSLDKLSATIKVGIRVCLVLRTSSQPPKMVAGLLVQTLGMAACLVIAFLTKVTTYKP